MQTFFVWYDEGTEFWMWQKINGEVATCHFTMEHCIGDITKIISTLGTIHNQFQIIIGIPLRDL